MADLRFVRRSSRKSALLILTVFAAATAGITGCDDSFTSVGADELAPPLGLRGITGNTQVTLIWFTSNFESDFEGYIVFQDSTGDRSTNTSTTLPSGFEEVLRIELNESSGDTLHANIDNLTNGTTYSFAVCAFKNDGSEISRTSNIIAETPRPDIPNVLLNTATTNDVPGEPPADDTQAGFDFTGFVVETVPDILSSPSDYVNGFGTDIVHEAFDPSGTTNIRSWMAGMNGGGVQDLGFMGELNDSDVAPIDGYAGQGESVLLTVGHVYAVQTGELPPRYGKFIVTQIVGSPDFTVTFNAAFQTKDGDPNYFPALGIKEP